MNKNFENKPLFNFNHGEITGAAMLDIRRPKKNTEIYPIKYRVTFKRKRVYYKSGYDSTYDEWQRLPETKSKILIEKKNLIKNGFDIIENHVKAIKDNFSFEILNNRIGRSTTDSVFIAYDTKIEKLKNDNKLNTADWYKYSKKALMNFAGKNLKHKDITISFLKRYEKHLFNENKSYTTVSMYMRALQAIINDGMNIYITKNLYPFGKDKYEIPAEKTRNLALTLNQIGKIVNYTPITENEARCRDLWLFSYFCNGINITDQLKLKYSDIDKATNQLSYYRQKTINRSKNKKKIYVVILPQMQEIINRWGNPDKNPDNFIFPILRKGLTPAEELRTIKNFICVINDKMKKIASILGLPKTSTYSARHSYASVLKRSGANIAYISESLGHTDLKTTENYLDSFEDEERKKNANLLTNY